MALLRWIHLRKLTPIEDLIAGARLPRPGAARAAAAAPRSRRAAQAAAVPTGRASCRRRRSRQPRAGRPRRPQPLRPAPRRRPQHAPTASVALERRDRPARRFKDALLAEIRKSKAVFYNMVVAQAQKIEVAADRVTFTFSANQRTLRETFEQHRAWLESIAEKIAGRRIVVDRVQAGAEPRRRRRPAGRATIAGGGGGRRTARIEETALRSRRWPMPACRRCSRSFPARNP